MTIAMAVVMSTFAGLFTGYYLDKKVFHDKTFPWLTIIFFLFGLAGGVKNFFVLMKRFSDELDPKKPSAESEGAGGKRQAGVDGGQDKNGSNDKGR